MQSKSIKSVLNEHSFFKHVEPTLLSHIETCASTHTFELNDILFYEGTAAECFYLIQDGQVAIQVFGGELGFIDIETLGAGKIVGWSWLLPPYQWYATAKALTHTNTIIFDAIKLRSLCEKNSDFGYDILKRLTVVAADRLMETRHKLIDNYCG